MCVPPVHMRVFMFTREYIYPRICVRVIRASACVFARVGVCLLISARACASARVHVRV